MARRRRHLGVPHSAGHKRTLAQVPPIRVYGHGSSLPKNADASYVILEPPMTPGDMRATRENVHAMLNNALRSLRPGGGIHLYVRPGAWGENGGSPSAWVAEWCANNNLPLTNAKER